MATLSGEIENLVGELALFEEDLASHPNILLTGKQIVKNITTSSKLAWVNIYPDGIRTIDCQKTLLVAIGQNDSVEISIRAATEHIAVKCKGVTNNVVFWAVGWSSLTWPDHKKSFRGINVVLKPFYANATVLIA